LREELAYAGGLFEGEGSIACYKRYDRRTGSVIQLTVSMTDVEPLQRFGAAIGVGKFYGPYGPYSTSKKPIYRWIVCGFEQTQAAVAMLWPWLGPRRREQVTAALQRHPREEQ